jgi:hypothetical protein
MAPHMPWIMPSAQPSMPYPGLLWPPNAPAEAPAGRAGKNESVARAARRQKRKLNEEAALERSTSGRNLGKLQSSREEKLMALAQEKMHGMTQLEP